MHGIRRSDVPDVWAMTPKETPAQEEKPLPCPWCESEPKVYDVFDGFKVSCLDVVECHTIEAWGPTKSIAIRRWNTRKSTPAQGLTEGRLREALAVIEKETAKRREPHPYSPAHMKGAIRLINEECKAALALSPSKAEEQAKALLEVHRSALAFHQQASSEVFDKARMKDKSDNLLLALQACKEAGL